MFTDSSGHCTWSLASNGIISRTSRCSELFGSSRDPRIYHQILYKKSWEIFEDAKDCSSAVVRSSTVWNRCGKWLNKIILEVKTINRKKSSCNERKYLVLVFENTHASLTRTSCCRFVATTFCTNGPSNKMQVCLLNFCANNEVLSI